MSVSLKLRLRPQIAEQVGEGGLEGVVVFPVREVGDVVFAEFDSQIFAGVGVEAAPVADAVEAHQPDGEQFLAWKDFRSLRRLRKSEFCLASFANLGLPPVAVQAVLREHQQRAVVELDGPVVSTIGVGTTD